jgi:SWI/SNF-related matrix-associated actin-dependent regulator of chromatin subfamily A member 5
MISVYDRKINAILADDMGLGKTIQVIAMIAFLKEQRDVDGPHLIVAPLSTIFNWEREFKKWLPQVSVIVLQATEAEREEAVAQRIKPRKFDVIVTSYEGAKKSLTALKKIDFHYFVVDEAHKLKSEECQLTEVLSSLNYGRSILLTGTPLQNNLHELWAILNFIMPNLFTNSLLFDDWF